MNDKYPNDDTALVTCALPYANGKAHLGHLRTYIPGDAFTRGLRKLGQDVVFVSGSDMHGTPIVVNAEEQGVEPEELAGEYHEYFESTFPEIDVDFDYYGNTHQESNFRNTREIVRKLDEAGYIYEDSMMVAYDPEHGRTLPDRYVEGECPHCGNEEARGDECDECGRHLEPGDIIDPVSKITGSPAEYVEQEHRFFALSEFKEFLREFVDDLEGTSNAKNQPKQWIEEGLQDWCITRDLDWGVPYPGEDDEPEATVKEKAEDELVLYVWVDAPVEYISATEEWSRESGDTDRWREIWQEDDGDIIHFIGGDIIQHHCVFWPAMLHGADYTLPRAVLASGLVKINDRAFSTSRGRAVWLDDDYLDEGFDPDLIRYYILSYTGFENDLNFSWSLFQERVNNEIVDTLANFTYRSLLLTDDNFGGVPDGTIDAEVEEAIDDCVERFRESVNDYDLKGVAEAGMALAGFGNEYIQQNQPWKHVGDEPEKAGDILFNCLQVSKAVALLLEPVMPSAAEEIWSQLDEDGDVHKATVVEAFDPVSGGLGKPAHVFEDIPDDEIDELESRLEERIAESDDGDDEGGEDKRQEKPDVDVPGISDDLVSFEEFQELDLRVGKIREVEDAEDSDSLLVLRVDVGVEERQVVAGLKGLHEPSDLVGKKVVMAANLEPAEIFGRESQGMVLAAGEDADLLTTYGDSPPGTEIE
ncbi:MAG: methionine--tRNA ligase [Halobacteria archaeon]